jgi:DNA-binding NtrC family response regulator
MDASEIMNEGRWSRNRGAHRDQSTVLDLEVLGAAATDVCILFTGMGSAKQLARRIHGLRRGRRGRFIAVDCRWPEAVLEKQIFDVLRPITSGPHELGDARPPAAGTLFLEEVGRLSPMLQGRLLDALVRPSGPGAARRSRARVMASSSESLLQRMLEGSFNDRLFYRLNAIHFVVEPDLGDL